MKRTQDVEFIDKISKELWAYVAQDGQEFASIGPWLANEQNIALANADGAFLLTYIDKGTYEVHTLFRRGEGAFEAAREAMFECYTTTDAVELYTKVPLWNAPALSLALKSGFFLQFVARTWKHEGKVYPIRFLRHTIEDWMRNEVLLPYIGKAFHEEIQALGVPLDHEEDQVHDRYVGAAYAMMQAHKPGKAAVYYNRWAAIYGAQPIDIISADPLIVDIGTAKLKLENGELCLSEPQLGSEP